MANKCWSYRQITELVEAQIKQIQNQAAGDRDERSVSLLQQWAYGVYIGWDGITTGWQNDGDGERIRTLSESVGRKIEEKT